MTLPPNLLVNDHPARAGIARAGLFTWERAARQMTEADGRALETR